MGRRHDQFSKIMLEEMPFDSTVGLGTTHISISSWVSFAMRKGFHKKGFPLRQVNKKLRKLLGKQKEDTETNS